MLSFVALRLLDGPKRTVGVRTGIYGVEGRCPNCLRGEKSVTLDIGQIEAN